MSDAGIHTPVHAEAPEGARSFLQRLAGAVRLEGETYDEIVADPGALAQAALVTGLAAVGRAIGSPSGPFSSEGLSAGLSVLLLWPLISGLVFALGNWFGHPVALGRVLRGIGFAMAPMALWVLNAIPFAPVQVAASFVAFALLIAGWVVATRHALAVPTGRAAFVVLVVAMIVVFTTFALVYARLQLAA